VNLKRGRGGLIQNLGSFPALQRAWGRGSRVGVLADRPTQDFRKGVTYIESPHPSNPLHRFTFLYNTLLLKGFHG
jgi:hypothetical protein